MTADRIDPARLLSVLRMNHRGKAWAISGPRLAAHFGFKETKRVREAVNTLRRQGYPVASGHDGYYIPATRQEAWEAYGFITAIFEPLRLAVEGYRAGIVREYGEPSLFDDVDAA